jgi:hypothetical protein
MKRLLLLLAPISFAAAMAAPPANSPANEAPYRAKSRSEFKVASGAHDPFWPIGYAHHEIAVAAPEQKPMFELKASLFNVSSISVSGQDRFAVINKKIFGVGDSVMVPVGSQKVVIRVAAIEDGTVTLQYEAQRVSVPISTASVAKAEPAPSPDAGAPEDLIPSVPKLPKMPLLQQQ